MSLQPARPVWPAGARWLRHCNRRGGAVPSPDQLRGEGGMQAAVTPLWSLEGDGSKGGTRRLKHGIIRPVHCRIIPAFLQAVLGRLEEFVGFLEAHGCTIARADRADKPAAAVQTAPQRWKGRERAG